MLLPISAMSNAVSAAQLIFSFLLSRFFRPSSLAVHLHGLPADCRARSNITFLQHPSIFVCTISASSVSPCKVLDSAPLHPHRTSSSLRWLRYSARLGAYGLPDSDCMQSCCLTASSLPLSGDLETLAIERFRHRKAVKRNFLSAKQLLSCLAGEGSAGKQSEQGACWHGAGGHDER